MPIEDNQKADVELKVAKELAVAAYESKLSSRALRALIRSLQAQEERARKRESEAAQPEAAPAKRKRLEDWLREVRAANPNVVMVRPGMKHHQKLALAQTSELGTGLGKG